MTMMRVQELYNNIQACIMHSARQATRRATGVRNSRKLSKSTIKLIDLREQARKVTQQLGRKTAEFAELNKRTKRKIRKDLWEYKLIRMKSVLEKSIRKAKKGKETAGCLGQKRQEGRSLGTGQE
jgi:molecular chaperone GrpE (heat shock protein)